MFRFMLARHWETGTVKVTDVDVRCMGYIIVTVQVTCQPRKQKLFLTA